MMTSSEGPLFSLASGSPTLNPPLIKSIRQLNVEGEHGS